MTEKQGSSLQEMINFPADGDGEQRRLIMREATNSFLVAPDRYDSKQMENFDLLYSFVIQDIERSVRRAFAMALTKSDYDSGKVKNMLEGEGSYLGYILRRTVLLPIPDLVTLIRERTVSLFGAKSTPLKLEQAYEGLTRFSLPTLILNESFRYIYFSQRYHLDKNLDSDISALLGRTAKRVHRQIVENATEKGREAVIEANRNIRELTKRDGVTEEYLRELFQTHNQVEVILALATKLNIDSCTMIRILNDQTWESLAIACRANKIGRSFFAEMVNSMNKRESDQHYSLRIIGLYNQLQPEFAERIMRFWQIRASASKELASQAADMVEQTNLASTDAKRHFA